MQRVGFFLRIKIFPKFEIPGKKVPTVENPTVETPIFSWF